MSKRVWIVLNNDGTTILCDTKAEMEIYRNLSSIQLIEGPYTMSKSRIKQERAYAKWLQNVRVVE